MTTRPQRVPPRNWWLVGAIAFAAFALLRAWQPSGSEFRLCVFRNLLDLPCPACGLTRAFSHLAHGELTAMLSMHPLAPVLAAEAGIGWLAWGLFGAGWLERTLATRPEILAVANVAPLLAVWFGRAASGSLPF